MKLRMLNFLVGILILSTSQLYAQNKTGLDTLKEINETIDWITSKISRYSDKQIDRQDCKFDKASNVFVITQYISQSSGGKCQYWDEDINYCNILIRNIERTIYFDPRDIAKFTGKENIDKLLITYIPSNFNIKANATYRNNGGHINCPIDLFITGLKISANFKFVSCINSWDEKNECNNEKAFFSYSDPVNTGDTFSSIVIGLPTDESDIGERFIKAMKYLISLLPPIKIKEKF